MDALSKGRDVVRGEGMAEFYERKSRFIGACAPARSEQEALDFLASVRQKHRGATHNVYAYRLYENNICRHSDDGEPSGTAGMPLLESFLRRNVYDFCCVATRYFGGVLLGAGGLVRAYARTGTLALEAAGIATLDWWRGLSFDCPYALYESLRRLLEAYGAQEIEALFAAEVSIRCAVPEGQWQTLLATLKEAAPHVQCKDTGRSLRSL